jgi:DNA-binding CsgD family transcriptional regulator/tetratricopeptide (TPR) repeat protein
MRGQVVGREAELAELGRAVKDAGSGHGRLTLLRGDAGIGKSRLAEYALDLARDQGMTVLRGQSHPLHTGLAYAPVVEAIRPHLAAVADHPELADLGLLMADPRLPAPPASDNPDLARTRMFEAVAHLVDQLAPAVLFIDDLHWADRGTVELLHYIGQGAHRKRLLVLSAYRPSDAGTPPEDLAVTVRRSGNEIALGPLPDAAVSDLVTALVGSAPEPDFLDNVTSRAKGVPLFVTALVHQGFQAGEAVPAIVRDVVLGRLYGLGEPERRLLETVAVAGEAGTNEILHLIFDLPIADTVKDLLVAGLITEHSAGRGVAYRVAHPLYAEVAYAEMTIGERRQVHAAVLSAIERVNPADVLMLAPHYREAGDLVDPVRATAIMTEAGRRALAMRAPDEAAKYLRAAADLAPPQQQPGLLDSLGQAYLRLGDFTRASEAWLTGVRLAQQYDLAEALAELRFQLAMLDSERQDSVSANDRLRAEVRRTRPESPDAMIQHFIYTMRHGSEADVLRVNTEMAEHTTGDHPAAVKAVGHLGRSVLYLFDSDFGPALTEAELALAQGKLCEAEAPFYAQYCRLFLSALYALNGDITESLECATESVRAGTMVELPSLRCFEHYALSFAHYLTGEVATALADIDAGIVVARSSGMPRSLSRVLALRAFLLAEQGRLTEADATLAEAREAYRSPDEGLAEIVALADTAICLYRGEAVADVEFVAAQTFSDPVAAMTRLLFIGLAAADRGDEAKLVECAAKLRSFSETVGLMEAFAHRLDGLRTRDPKLLTTAADSFTGMRAHVLSAQTRLEWAELTGDRDSVPQILDTLEKAGAGMWTDRARRHARAVGLRIRPTRTTGVLTARETQVVRLLGEGLSNADIAARLYLSERTVETHLRNSYAKLNLTSRIALARWAAEHLTAS